MKKVHFHNCYQDIPRGNVGETKIILRQRSHMSRPLIAILNGANFMLFCSLFKNVSSKVKLFILNDLFVI